MKILPIIILFIQLRLAAFQWKRFDGDPTTRRTTKKTRYKFKDSLDIVKYYGSTNPLNGLRSNFPLNMTAEYLESLVGHEDLLRTHDELEVLHHKPESLSKLPKDFDARKEWPICEPIIGHVREQGQCDAAWVRYMTIRIGNKLNWSGAGGGACFGDERHVVHRKQRKRAGPSVCRGHNHVLFRMQRDKWLRGGLDVQGVGFLDGNWHRHRWRV